MVKSTDSSWQPYPATVDIAGRVRLPDACAAQLDWLQGKDAIHAWLLVVGLGRYRLLSDKQVRESARLNVVAERVSSHPQPDQEIEPFQAEDSSSAALAARLLQVRLSPLGPGWRLTLPKDRLGLFGRPATKTDNTVYLLFSDGYLEIWSVDHLIESIQAPLDQVIP